MAGYTRNNRIIIMSGSGAPPQRMNSSAGLTCFCVSSTSHVISFVAMANHRITNRRICAAKAKIGRAIFDLIFVVVFLLEFGRTRSGFSATLLEKIATL